jgi:hypothetical protein
MKNDDNKDEKDAADDKLKKVSDRRTSVDRELTAYDSHTFDMLMSFQKVFVKFEVK